MEQNNLKISKRLIDIAGFLPEGASFADIGSDHAYLPCYVCLRDKSAKAVAGEVNQGPFDSARKNIKKLGLEQQITVRLGDGLQVIKDSDELEQVVIAGMGGGLIAQILNDGKPKLHSVQRLILQPNVNARKVRIWLEKHGFVLVEERILEEKGHLYEILVADRLAANPYVEGLMEKQLLLGPFLLQEKSPVFYKKWEVEKNKLQRVISQMEQSANTDQYKIRQFRKELKWIKEELIP